MPPSPLTSAMRGGYRYSFSLPSVGDSLGGTVGQ
jgi:hypothetical protein